MALKKPSDIFGKKEEDNNVPIVEPNNGLREELSKVENLSEQISQLQQELTQKVIKNDLESLVLSQINKMQEDFDVLQTEFAQSNQRDINEFSEKITELTEIVNNLVETEIPKYKKKITKNELFVGEKVQQLQQSVEENINEIREEVDNKFENIADVVDNNIQYFNSQLEETSSQVKKTTETYTNLSKIVESRISKENEQLEKYSQTIEDIQKGFNELQQVLDERVSVSQEIVEEKFVEYQEQTEEKINHHQKEFKDTQIKLERFVDNRLENYRQELVDVKADVVINEQHIKKVDKYLQEHHQELIELKEEVFDEIEKLPVGNLQENLERLERKIDFIKETYSRIEPEVIVKEVIKEGLLNEPPNVKNGDPLTPLNQNFVTLDQLQQHYRLFLNRIQQQLSTLGGGGETRLKYLDDIVGIATNASAYDGKYLRYNHSSGKFEFEVAQVTPDSIVLGTDTTGDYVQSISGTANQITVSGGTGESSTPVVSIAPNPLLPGNVTIANDLQVNNNLNVTGNITIGGTSAYIISNDFRVKDADIVLGFTTSNNGADVSNDTTANHGGIAIASTEGTPLVQLYNPAIGETNPVTYKKIMWFKSGAFAGLNTDAWLINYAVGIGSTQFPSGTRLAVGAVQFTERDLAVVRNINASGIVTGNSFRPSSGYIQAADGTNSIYIYSGTGDVAFQGKINTSQINSASGYKALDFGTTTTPSVNITNSLNVGSGVSVVGVATVGTAVSTPTIRVATIQQSNGTQAATIDSSGNITASQNLTVNGFVGIGTTNPSYKLHVRSTGTAGVGQTIAWFTEPNGGDRISIVDETTVGTKPPGIRAKDALYGLGLYANSGPIIFYNGTADNARARFDTSGNFLIGTGTSTGTASQRLQVTGGAYVSGSVGIGTTNPTSTLQVSGTLYNSGIGTFANGNTTYGLSSASSLELGLNNNNNAGTLKIWGTTSNSYGLIQGTTSNLHIDCVGGGTYLNYYDGDFISFGNGASVESARFTGSTGVLTLGSITATGTASQRLQVTGGAYVSSNTGIGTTNPTSALHVIGNALITGVTTSSGGFGGNLSGNVNSTGVSTFTDIRLNSVSEKSTRVSGNTVNLVYNTGGGNIAICTNPTGPITLNVTGIPTDASFDNRVLTFTVVAIQTAIGYACTTVNLNGVPEVVRYPGGVISVGSTGSYDIFNFTGINTVGSASTTANYQVLGIVNGNFK